MIFIGFNFAVPPRYWPGSRHGELKAACCDMKELRESLRAKHLVVGRFLLS
jgi:hypothetical protein